MFVYRKYPFRPWSRDTDLDSDLTLPSEQYWTPPRTGGEPSGFLIMALPAEPPPKSQNPPRTGGKFSEGSSPLRGVWSRRGNPLHKRKSPPYRGGPENTTIDFSNARTKVALHTITCDRVHCIVTLGPFCPRSFGDSTEKPFRLGMGRIGSAPIMFPNR